MVFWMEKAIKKFGKIDILVNNAGASSRLRPFMEMTEEDWDFDIQTNLYGQMRVARAVLPHMLARKYGRIINTSGGQGIPNISIYGAAKGGVVQFTKALAREVASQGVIVNAVGPGLGKTGLVYRAPQEFLEGERRASLLHRLCEPSDVAPVADLTTANRTASPPGRNCGLLVCSPGSGLTHTSGVPPLAGTARIPSCLIPSRMVSPCHLAPQGGFEVLHKGTATPPEMAIFFRVIS